MPRTSTAGLTSDEKVLERLAAGKNHVKRGLADRDGIACKRFLDGSENADSLLYGDANTDSGVLPESQEVGSVNYLAINILVKAASIAFGDPDFHVDCGEEDPLASAPPYPPTLGGQMGMGAGGVDPATGMPIAAPTMPLDLSKADFAEIVRIYLKTLWKARGWARTSRKALIKRSISGMGIIAALWHPDLGPVLEHVRAQDLAINPNVRDWDRPGWAARRLWMDREEAARRYPKFEHLFDLPPGDIPNLDEPSGLTKHSVEIWTYWDETTETVIYGSDVLVKGPNLYKRVPLYFLEGDIAPESEFSIGDYDIAIGQQMMLARLIAMIMEQAENSGAIGWYNPALMHDQTKQSFEDQRSNGFIALNGDATDCMGYIQGMPLSPALLEAFRLMQQGLDSTTGVSEYQRGVLNQQVKFATEAALLANQSGARGTQARVEFEQFLDKLSRAVLDMTTQFAPSLMLESDEKDMLLLEAISLVEDVCVQESSTTYKDPANEQQSNLMLLQVLMPFIDAGLINPLPLIMDVLRAFGKRDTSKYINSQARGPLPPNSGGPVAPSMSPGGNPAPGSGTPPAVPFPNRAGGRAATQPAGQ